MSHVVPVLAIDGPSGSGKGTVSRAVARRLGWNFLDSGAIYRALGLAVERDGLSLDDQDAVARLAGRMDLRFSSGEPPSVWLDQIDVTDRIPTESCGAMASAVAALKPVRQALLQKQRDFRQLPGLVADGRDMGTVVFPDAEFKVFLTASAAVRAQRRHKQLKEKGVDVTLARLTKDIEERDERDRTRAEAPLRIADGALVIDSSDLGIDEVIARCLAVVGVL
ncbi:(d)CMP kinase [Methylotetracoccus oryzae]|uniref:(d)CMP kinase n=1 Tax=Methylotetracoccus oryzae TaxID=1919059 RepID=UPI0011196310|nr:(d)CMP kinase [Methylotetracoccus oryzae]